MWNANRNLVEEHSHNNSNVFRWSDISSSSRRHERAVFTFPDEDEEDIQFDTSDAAENRELVDGTKYTSIQEFASAIPNHLLLGSLLEHLCFVYEKDPQRSRLLFKAISKRLVGMNLLSPLAVCDEFSTVRLQHNRAFTELLHMVSTSLFPQDHRCLNADSQRLKLRFRMEDIFQAQTSRYLSEFEEICKLGKGSYGKVFKVKNKLDGQSYAVKKILIKDVTREDCMKVLREVKVLSSLQHPNIVGYHTAWMEHVQPVRNDSLSVELDESKVSKSNMSTCPSLEKLSLKDDYSEESLDSSGGSFIVFENSDCQEREKQDAAPEVKAFAVAKPNQSQAVCPKGPLDDFIPCVFLRNPMAATGAEGRPVAGWDGSVSAADHTSRSLLELNNNSCLDPDSQQWDERCSREGQFHLLLYIQMQLCERSLSDWILERNRLTEELAPPSDPYSCVDPKKTFAILRTILEGVQYIHSRGIMHRDLKPRNIFLHGHDCHVKIGDFGLACKDIIVDATEQLPCTSHIRASSHTTGVGTFVYAAPEVLEGSNYDSKSDMYSVGIVALELFQPFGTEMERVQRLGELRQGNVLKTFSQHWPVLAKYIRLLVSPDHLLRPSPAELLRSELFDDTNMVIHSLQRKVEEQEEEILKLKRQISQLQNIQKTGQQTDLT